MELPGDFFVDSMDVALAGAKGLRWAEELLPPLVAGPVASPAAPGCVGSCPGERGCNRRPPVREGAGGSPPCSLPRGDGSTPGGCRAPAQPPSANGSGSATRATLFGRISFGLTLKCSSRASKPEVKPKRAARARTIGFGLIFDVVMILNWFSFQIKLLLFNFFEAGNGKLPIN